MDASLYLHTIVRMGQKQSLKQEILKKCDEQNDEWASQGAVSDLHAADACYHKSCRAIFISPRSRSVAQREEQEGDEDQSLQVVISALNEDQSKIWNSV